MHQPDQFSIWPQFTGETNQPTTNHRELQH